MYAKGNDSGKSSVLRAILDTNVLVSALEFGGKPRAVLSAAFGNKFKAVSSRELLAELAGVLKRDFEFSDEALQSTLHELQITFDIVSPTQHIDILADEPDNRVLEAASTGSCHFVVTGDKALLALGSYGDVRIVSVEEFLRTMQQ